MCLRLHQGWWPWMTLNCYEFEYLLWIPRDFADLEQWRSQKFRGCITPIVSNFQTTTFTVSVESGTLIGERVITCHTSSIETGQKLRRCIVANIRRRQHAVLQPFRRRTQQVCRRWCQLRLTQAFVTWQDWWKWPPGARARAWHTIFGWSTIVAILHRFQDRPLTQWLKIARYRSIIWGPVRDDRHPNSVQSCPKARMTGLSGGETISTNLCTF